MLISEVISKEPAIVKSDALTISDSYPYNSGIINYGDADFNYWGEYLQKEIGLNKAEACSIQDNIVKISEFNKSLVEAIVISELIGKDFQSNKEDSLSIEDEIKKASEKYLAENITVVDSLSKLSSKELAEFLAIADILSKRIEIEKGEILTLNTTFETLGQKFKTLSDNISIADAIQNQVGFNIFLSDSLTVIEILVKDFGMGLVDALTIIESLTTAETEPLKRKTILVTNKNKVILLTTRNRAIISSRSQRPVIQTNLEGSVLRTNKARSILRSGV